MGYNLLSCSGFDTAGGWIAGGGCMRGRIGIIILFFIIALARKWGGEELGIDFNFWLSLVLGIIPYIITISIFGNYKVAFVVGLAGAIVGGYLGGMILGGTE